MRSTSAGFVRITAIGLAAVLTGAGAAGNRSGNGGAAVPVVRHQLMLVEQFLANGAEPTFWTSTSVADLERGPGVSHPIEFGISLKSFDTAIGGEPPIALVVAEGANRIAIGEDPETREIALEGDLAVVGFVNGILERMSDDLDRSSSWEEVVRVFDGSILPGFDEVEVMARFSSTVHPVGKDVMRLLKFDTDSIAFESAGSSITASFRGAALVDGDMSVAYHMLFQQVAEVTGESGQTNLEHTTALYLADASDAPIVAIDAFSGFEDVYSEYQFFGQPEVEDLFPHLLDPRPRPAWANLTWIAGRLANAALGGVAEGSLNPVPVLSLGSVVLTDQSIYYAGNIFVDRKALEQGLKSETEMDFHDGDFRSPLQYALAGEDAEPVPMDQRLRLLDPEMTGAARIGALDDPLAVIIPIGITLEVATALLASSSKLGAILGSASASAIPSASVVGVAGGTSAATISATTIAVAGVGAAGAGVAVAEGSSSGGGGEEPGPEPPGNAIPIPCNTAVVQGGEGITSTEHELGTDPGTVNILFNAGDGVADELDVFFNGALVASSGEVLGSTNVTFEYAPSGDVTTIVVVVTGGVASVWDYVVSCPQ